MNKIKKYEPENTWFNYCIDIGHEEIIRVIDETYITSNGRKIHIDIYGKNENLDTNILFIHGTAVYSRFYAEFLYNLYKKGYRIIAPDLPGHGVSEGKRGHFDMKLLTSTIYDVSSYIIDNFGENLVIMGSSLGGITAFYCIANDNRIKAGICHNAAIFNEGAHKKIVKVKGIYKYLKPLIPILSKIIPTLRISVWIYLDPNELVRDTILLEKLDILLNDKLISDKYTLKSLATQMKAPLARPIEEIETPIMIINGDKDVLFSVEYMESLFNRLKKSRNKRLEIIPNSSHFILHEEKDESIKRIVNWLKEIF
ncbi:MAG: alpha/beta hydrolase [Candidatus Helarchaeota archaeon]